MSEIVRMTPPNLDYIDDTVFKTLGFEQINKAGPTVYISGIAPMKGSLEELEVQGVGDVGAQFSYTLEVLDRCLKGIGLSTRNLVSVYIFTSAVAELSPHLGLFTEFVGEFRPTTTTLEVKGFIHPDQLIEITATAYDES
jgi:2-iminobutanoate/2-iminopropanoate deaminase